VGDNAMVFTVLGRVGIVAGRESRTVTRAQARGLFGLMLLNPMRPILRDSIVEALWGGTAPPTARSQVQASVYAIRRMLAAAGSEALVAGGAFGYQLLVSPQEIDLFRFDEGVRRARDLVSSGDDEGGLRLLRDSLSLWQGVPLADAAGAFVDGVRARLTSKWLTAIEDLADLELRLERYSSVADELGPIVDAHPLREGLTARLMVALSRSGRVGDALDCYASYRRQLAESQGLDPSAELAALQGSILRQSSVAMPTWVPETEPGALVALESASRRSA
jgi:DNA-binding SARP family transcriptional activator